MAARGPDPSGKYAAKADSPEWVEVPNVPYVEGRERPCPIAHRPAQPPSDEFPVGTEETPHPATVRWWNAVREMPHARLWTDTDWTFVEDLCLLKERFYQGFLVDSALSEMRRREDQIATTVEARRKNRIRYVQPTRTHSAPEPEAATGTEGNVTPITGRRSRLLDES